MHEQLASGKYQLDDLLDEYQFWINEKQLKKKKFKTEREQLQFVQDQLASFNMFFDVKYGWTLPSLFEEKGINIVENPMPNSKIPASRISELCLKEINPEYSDKSSTSQEVSRLNPARRVVAEYLCPS